MPVRKIKQCIFVQSIMDWMVNNVHSGEKKLVSDPKSRQILVFRGGGKFL